MWAVARFDLRIPEEEIGRLNLKEYDALIQRKKTEDNWARFNFGVVASAIINSNPFGDSNREAVSPLDFVPDWKDKQSKETLDLTQLSPEDQLSYFMKAFGSAVVVKG